MEAKELRIGNLVTTSEILINIHKIKVGDISNILDGTYDSLGIEVSPIPLTEDWLVKLGFDNGTTKLLSEETDAIISYARAGCWVLSNGKGGLQLEMWYLHQLQNLYFVLTGTELTYD
jgi:hypothetical protein